MIEIENTKTLEQVGGRNHWIGIRSFLTYATMVQSESLSLWHQAWPGMSGDSAPIVKRTRAIYHPSGVPNVAMIMAFYESPRVPGKARLVTQTQSRAQKQKLIREPAGEGRVIEGPDPLYDWGHWQVVQGDNVSEEYYTLMRLETAAYKSQVNLANIYALRNCVNQSPVTLVGFGTAGAESLLCHGVVMSGEYGDDMIDLTYLFEWSGPDETWNEKVKSQLGAWVVQSVPVFDADGEEVSQQNAVVWQPAVKLVRAGGAYAWETVEPEARMTHRTKDFAGLLAGLTEW